MKEKRVIAVDFDGVIAEYDHWRGITHFGKPIKKTIDELQAEKAIGTYIIIHSTRTNPAVNSGYTVENLVEILKGWFEKNNVPYDEIWAGIGKPIADEYWDDRAVRKP